MSVSQYKTNIVMAWVTEQRCCRAHHQLTTRPNLGESLTTLTSRSGQLTGRQIAIGREKEVIRMGKLPIPSDPNRIQSPTTSPSAVTFSFSQYKENLVMALTGEYRHSHGSPADFAAITMPNLGDSLTTHTSRCGQVTGHQTVKLQGCTLTNSNSWKGSH